MSVTLSRRSVKLTDDRENRGKRHALVFVVAAVVLAILSGRSKVSSIFRYIRNRINWLREITQHPEASVVSRAHLPRRPGNGLRARTAAWCSGVMCSA